MAKAVGKPGPMNGNPRFLIASNSRVFAGDNSCSTCPNAAYGVFPATLTVVSGQMKTLKIRTNDGLEQDPFVFSKE